jgi:hypothetical protein
VIDGNAFVMELHGDAAIAIAAFTLMEYFTYSLLLYLISITLFEGFQMVIECRASHPPDLQQQVETILRP